MKIMDNWLEKFHCAYNAFNLQKSFSSQFKLKAAAKHFVQHDLLVKLKAKQNCMYQPTKTVQL